MVLWGDSNNLSACPFFRVLPLKSLSPLSQYVLHEAEWYLAHCALIHAKQLTQPKRHPEES